MTLGSWNVRPWTTTERSAAIKMAYEGLSRSEIAVHVNRTRSAVSAMLNKSGIKANRLAAYQRRKARFGR